jgi:hypothetical protein
MKRYNRVDLIASVIIAVIGFGITQIANPAAQWIGGSILLWGCYVLVSTLVRKPETAEQNKCKEVDKLISALEHRNRKGAGDEGIRLSGQAAAALADLGDMRAIPPLEQMLRDLGKTQNELKDLPQSIVFRSGEKGRALEQRINKTVEVCGTVIRTVEASLNKLKDQQRNMAGNIVSDESSNVTECKQHINTQKRNNMSASRDQLVAQVQALSLKKHIGTDVSGEVREILQKCQSEEDKQLIKQLCNALGLSC